MHSCRCVRALLEHGTDVERECEGGQTALILATEHGNAECVRALLDAGANRSHITAVSFFLSHSQTNSVLMYHCYCGDYNQWSFKQYHTQCDDDVLNIRLAASQVPNIIFQYKRFSTTA